MIIHRLTTRLVLCALGTVAFMTVLSLASPAARAATIAFDPQETTVGTAQPFLIGITIDSDVAVNTIRAVIDVPESMDIVEASDGNSVINFWIERPHITDAHQLVFAGIIPGGFVGNKGKLVTLTVRAKKRGSFDFIFNPSSGIYANDGLATRQSVASRPLRLDVVAGKDNIMNIIPDTVAPETFTPVLVEIPDGGKGSWAVSFVAQDKISGISSYEVAESFTKFDQSSTRSLSHLKWRIASSPYILSDQELSSHIYVRATDGNGNTRVAYVAPHSVPSWYRTPGGYILIALCLFLALYGLSRRLHWKRE